VTRLLVSSERHDARLKALQDAARKAGVPVLRQPVRALDRLAEGVAHQGCVALVAEAAYTDPSEILQSTAAPALFVVLDGVEDPRNLGAVIRSAAAAGAGGIFLPEHRATGLTAACLKAAAGAAERLPIARVGNIVSFLKDLKKRGIWIAGFDASGTSSWTGFDLTMPVALVFGGEEKGLRRLARETCDVVLSIPLCGGVESLNLSVAAGIALFEAVRQRTAAGHGKECLPRTGSRPAKGRVSDGA
jgi:23S rRNA (guanosine2251-2'-O)-methyltransferase